MVRKQVIIPIAVGKIKARAVHLRLPVSFFIVSMLVVQGQWNSENNITLSAVKVVQPLLTNIVLKTVKSEIL